MFLYNLTRHHDCSGVSYAHERCFSDLLHRLRADDVELQRRHHAVVTFAVEPADGAWRVSEIMQNAITNIGKKYAIKMASGALWPDIE